MKSALIRSDFTNRQEQTREQGKRGVRSALALGLLGLLLYGGIMQRVSVVKAIPQSAILFSAIGLPVNAVGADIRAVRARIEGTGAEQNLVVEGEVVNLRRGSNTVPDISLSLIDGNGHVLYTWLAPLRGNTIKPAEKLTFRTNLALPPAGNRRVIVAFAR